MLRLHDTATGRVEAPPGSGGGSPVRLYVCGPTVYGPPHAGHGRLVLAFDALRRWLEHRRLDVRHVENVTDVDDKIIDRALREGRRPEAVAEESEAQWWSAMDRLGALRPHAVPHATDWVDQVIELVAALLERRAAYAISDGVYLDTSAVADYGLLKHQDVGSLLAGARVAVNEDKRAVADFALWKAAKPGEPSWPAPFGPGRPGWHSECVAMSLGLLGEGFELHGGGADLIFPHHENERAQAVALGRQFARAWLHSGLLTVGQEKMSKSLGNFTTLEELFAEVDPRAFRLLVLQAHYRSPLEVRAELLEDAGRALERLDSLARRVADPGVGGLLASGPSAEADSLHKAFGEAMDDDLDTPGALAVLFSAARRANGLLDGAGEERLAGAALAGSVLADLAVLGLDAGTAAVTAAGAAAAPDEHALGLLSRRDAARAGGDFATADRLRDELATLGWRVEDGAGGSRLRR